MEFPHLFSPLHIGNRTVRNRIVSTAHGEHWAEAGALTDRLVRYHVRRAQGGVGLIITFGSASVYKGAAHSDMVGLWDAGNEPRLRELATGVHAHGALLLAQATHRGPRESPLNLDDPLQAPSPLPAAFADGYRGTPHVLTVEEIQGITTAYADAAARLERCGYDGIELTALGTHLFEQFWSPALNTRTDRYGGDFENRMRFSLEVLAAVDQAVSRDFLVSFRLSGELATDLLGLGLDDITLIARHLDSLRRINLFSVSGGSGANTATHAACVPTDTFSTGTYNRVARVLKSCLSVPVLVAGRILEPAQAEEALRDADCDLVGMTRALIADPDMPLRAREGETARTRPCIAINEGCRRVTMGMAMACSVNPAIADESLDSLTPATPTRRVVVIGGGPAGMEAARVAAQRGHDVTLYERSAVLGGQMHAYAAMPGRPHLLGHVRWLERELETLGVEVRLGVEVTVDMLQSGNPDVLILATGARTALPPEAMNLSPTTTTDEAIITGREKVSPGDHVVVYDVEGRSRGAQTALLAAEAGAASVDLVFPYEMTCPNLEPPNRPAIFRGLAEAGIHVRPHTIMLAPSNGALRLRDTWSERETIINDVSLFVVAGYRRAEDDLARTLNGQGTELHLIGDCRAPRLLRNAVAEGVRVGARI